MAVNGPFKNLIVNTVLFDKVVSRLRLFFQNKGFLEVHTQNRLSILAACEDPSTISTFKYAGTKFPLPQTGQMWLEHEMLKNPNVPGYYCVSTSYRHEKKPVPGRHELVFPMFEFETHGGMAELYNLERDLLKFMGYKTLNLYVDEYDNLAAKLNVTEITHVEEMKMYNDMKQVVAMITNFPEHTSPFWNMSRSKYFNKSGIESTRANKIDVILSGMETIGSAERETDVDIMRNRFRTISGGEYSRLLYSIFGQKRVDEELDEYLSNKFFQRCGGGIGITRLIRSLHMEKLVSDSL